MLLGVLFALTALGTDAWLPALPVAAQALGAPVAGMQLTVTTYFLGLAAGQLVWGPLSDRYGRKPVLLAGLALALLASAVCAAADSAAALVLARLAQGFGMSAGPVMARTIVRDLHGHEQAARLLARMTIVFSVIPIAAPLAGGLMVVLGGWRAVFWLLGGVAALLAAAVALRLAETVPAERASAHPAQIARSFAAIAAEPRFLAPYGAMLCAQIGIFAFVSNSAFTLVSGLGVAPGAFALLFALVMVGQIAGAWLSSRLVMRVGMAAPAARRNPACLRGRPGGRAARLVRGALSGGGGAALHAVSLRFGAHPAERHRARAAALRAHGGHGVLPHGRHAVRRGRIGKQRARRAVRRQRAPDGHRGRGCRPGRVSHRKALPAWTSLSACAC